MQERCCEKDNGMDRDFRRAENPVSRILAMLTERDEKVAEITACPGSCTDGLVSVRLQSNGDRVQQIVCPALHPDCAFGAVLQKQIDRHLAGLMTSRIGIPRRHVGHFERYFETVATKEAIRWKPNGFLLLTGKTGTGKSYAAAWLVNPYIRNRAGDPYKSESWTWRAKVESIASGVIWRGAQSIADDRGIAAEAKRSSLLILDDLGKESTLPSAKAAMQEVVSLRYDNELPTVITTELTVSDIDARYGRAIVERIVGEAEDGGKFITCGEVSLRLVKG